MKCLVISVHFPSKDMENYTLGYSFQHMPGTIPGKSQKLNSSQQELNDNWTKLLYERGWSTQEGTEREVKHAKESEHCLNQTSTANRYTDLLEEESGDQQQKSGPENTPKPPPICITDVTNISPLIQPQEQIAIWQYEVKALAHNQVKVQPKTPEPCRNYKSLSWEMHTVSHIQIERIKKLQTNVKKYALLHQPSRNQNWNSESRTHGRKYLEY
jgi:hypothetical protein